MQRNAPFRRHRASLLDLITTHEQTRAGFIALALEKNRRASPVIDQARALRTIAHQAKKPWDLIILKDIKPALLTAAGISDKAAKFLRDEDQEEAVRGLIENFLE